MARLKKGFTIAELVLVLVLVAAFATIAVPRLDTSVISKKNAELTSKKIVADLRRVRMLAISNAANNPTGFSINMIGSTPYSGYQVIDCNSSTAVESQTIDSDVQCSGGSRFQFGPLGNLINGSDTQLFLSSRGKVCTLIITTATGTIKCSEN